MLVNSSVPSRIQIVIDRLQQPSQVSRVMCSQQVFVFSDKRSFPHQLWENLLEMRDRPQQTFRAFRMTATSISDCRVVIYDLHGCNGRTNFKAVWVDENETTLTSFS